MKSILRDPLLHFLFLAIGLFVLHEIVAHDDADANTRQIVVDRAARILDVIPEPDAEIYGAIAALVASGAIGGSG